MSYPSPGESHDPDRDPTQPGEQPAPPQYPDPYGPASASGQQPGPPYGQYGQYGQQPGYPPYGQPAGTNIMAILSLVFAFVFAPVGIVLGHVAKRQIRQTGEQGDSFATAGLVLSYIFTGIYVLGCCAGLIAVFATGGGNRGY